MGQNVEALRLAAQYFDITDVVGERGLQERKVTSFHKQVVRHGALLLTVVGVPFAIGLLVRDLVRLRARYQEMKINVYDRYISADPAASIGVFRLKVNRTIHVDEPTVKKFRAAHII